MHSKKKVSSFMGYIASKKTALLQTWLREVACAVCESAVFRFEVYKSLIVKCGGAVFSNLAPNGGGLLSTNVLRLRHWLSASAC